MKDTFLGKYKSLQTTMVYTHEMNRGPMRVKSPGDNL